MLRDAARELSSGAGRLWSPGRSGAVPPQTDPGHCRGAVRGRRAPAAPGTGPWWELVHPVLCTSSALASHPRHCAICAGAKTRAVQRQRYSCTYTTPAAQNSLPESNCLFVGWCQEEEESGPGCLPVCFSPSRYCGFSLQVGFDYFSLGSCLELGWCWLERTGTGENCARPGFAGTCFSGKHIELDPVEPLNSIALL